mgnify:CR=1 FL=1|jgi:nucleoside 2-deoxyribosyltransferase
MKDRKLAIYLAGPDVFYPEAKAVGESLKALCSQYGFEGIFPLDFLPSDLFTSKYTKKEASILIKNACVEGIKNSDILLANMTPFRGVSMDIGTGFEMGYADAMGLAVYGYSNDPRSYIEKIIAAEFGAELYSGAFVDREGQIIEDLNNIDNCMVTEACGNIFYPDPFGMTAFEKALKYIHGYVNADSFLKA